MLCGYRVVNLFGFVGEEVGDLGSFGYFTTLKPLIRETFRRHTYLSHLNFLPSSLALREYPGARGCGYC